MDGSKERHAAGPYMVPLGLPRICYSKKKKQAMMREKIDQKVIFVIFSSASAQIDGTLHETKQNPRVHLQSTN